MWSRGLRLTAPGAAAPARWRPAPAPPAPSPAPARSAAAPDAPDETPEPAGQTLEEQLAEAYRQGSADAQTVAERALCEERQRLTEAIREISGLRRAVLDAADHDVMHLAVGMARRILHREVQLDPDVLLAMAHVAIGRLGDRAVATVHLHPVDLAALSADGVARAALTLVADLDVPRGGCRVTSERGEIDLGIDAQMTELARGLLDDHRDRQHADLH